MSKHKQIVERYIDGYCRRDSGQILSCLTDDVVWALHGYATLHGKAAFAAELQHDDPSAAAPRITLDRLVEEGDTVAVMGHGDMPKQGGGRQEFVFSELFTFAGDAISRLDTFHIDLR